MDHSNMRYTCKSASPIVKQSTIFVGLTANAVLSSTILGLKAAELVSAWPILGGKLMKKTTPWSFTCGSTVDYACRTSVEPLASYLPLNHNDRDRPSMIESPKMMEVYGELLFNGPLGPNAIFKLGVTILDAATLLCFGMAHQRKPI